MYSLNRAQIIGYLTQDPNIRKTPSGQSVGDINIATKHTFKDANGNLQQGTAFHSIVVWRGLADVCAQYLREGSQVFFSGRLKTDEWQGDDGQKRQKTRITADEMIMLDSRNPIEGVDANTPVQGCLNSAEVIGNLTRDPEIRTTPNGTAVTTIGVATNFSWKGKDGEEKDVTEFHNVVLWGELAEEAGKYFKKGRKVYARGRLQTRNWETPTGDKRYTTEIIADDVSLLGTPAPADLARFASGKSEAAVGAAPKAAAKEVTEDMVPEVNYESDVKPEDLPF